MPSHWFGNTQGVYAVTPSGKLLAAGPGWVNIDNALAEWAALPESERKPGAVKVEPPAPQAILAQRYPAPPADSLIIRVYQRVTGIPKEDATGLRYRGEPTPDFLWLTHDDWKLLVPENAKKGNRILVPEELADFVCRGYLRDSTRGCQGGWEKVEARQTTLALTVDDVSPQVIRLRLNGRALLASDANPTIAQSGYDAQLAGFLDYDVAKKAFTRFDVVADGDAWGHAGGEQGSDYMHKKRVRLGVAFELAKGDQAGDVIFPGTFPGHLQRQRMKKGP